jgi:hypothetical protein
MKYLNKKFFLNADAPIYYKFLRLIGHYVALPIKVTMGLLLGLLRIKKTVYPLKPRRISAINELITCQYDMKKINQILKKYIQAKYLCNKFEDGAYYAEDVDDNLLAFVVNRVSATNDADVLDKYEFFMTELIKNDLSILQGTESKEYSELYKEFLEQVNFRPELVRMKSKRGSFNPSLFLDGEQALTLLAAIRVYDKKLKTPDGAALYNKLLWVYGYGLLAIFSNSTTGVGAMSLAKLEEYADTKLGMWYWKFVQYLYEKRLKIDMET